MSAVSPTQANSSSDSTVNVVESANDADIKTVAEDAVDNSNPIKTIVDEIVGLMGLTHEEREELLARGIPFHTANMMIEMGTNEKHEELAEAKKTALALSVRQYGTAAITAEKLDERINALVALKRDTGLALKVAKSGGHDMTVINMLTMTIRQNPGDGGEKAVNTYLAYAIACDIPVSKVEQMVADLTASPKSVLPQIELEQEDERLANKKRMISDVAVGCVLALIAMLLFT
ncbi:MAG: hypothetical protein V3U65_01560 [Granulosicoccaceae bacterium]